MSDTIAAVATGNAVSAIGIIRLSGDDAIRIADAVFTPRDGKPMSEHDSRMLVLGTLRDADGRTIDECMCTVSRAPRSYTGEDTAELQCHGSPTVLRCALEALFANGARQAKAGEFTKRAFLNGRMDLTQAEAVADLIDAKSTAGAHNAAAQLGGAISRAVEEIYSNLVDIMSHYHAVLDWPDEDIEPFEQENYIATLDRAVTSLRRLLSTFERGRVLREGVPAAIIGLPNAGKSSLLNALLGYDRAIVTSAPGTTRDTITEAVSLGGVLLRLTDTAGQRDALDEAERRGVERSRAAAREAELVLGLIDGSVPPEPGIEEIIKQAENAPHGVIVITKSDLPCACGEIQTTLPTVQVSSVTGEGIAELERLVSEMFPVPVTPAGEILTNARQAEAVGRAVSALESAREAMTDGVTPDAALTGVEEALGALAELTGRTVRDDVVERIFSRFCVGK